MEQTADIPRHNLDHPGVVKLLLSVAASEAIAASGQHHLAVITRPDATSPPEAQGRMILHIIATDPDALNLAFGVIRGTHRATRIKTTPPSPSAPLTSKEIRNA